MIICKYMIFCSLSIIDAILYGVMLSWMKDNNDVWALLRYIVLFISIYGLEKICERIEIKNKEKFRIGIVVICMISEFLLGYFLATAVFASWQYWACLLILVLAGILELSILAKLLKGKTVPDKEEYKDIKTKEIYDILTIGENADQVIHVKCSFWLGVAMLFLCIILFVIPIFIRNTYFELLSLFGLGAIGYIAFCVANYKKYIFYSAKKKLGSYCIEVLGVLICVVLMYYVDGFVYRGKAFMNILINIIYVVCVMPFFYSSKKISVEIGTKLSRTKKDKS